MKKVFVIGSGIGLAAIEEAKKVLQLKEDVEIICVKSREDIPFIERIKSYTSIREILEIKAPPIISEIRYFEDKKRKGHERPYKYHP